MTKTNDARIVLWSGSLLLSLTAWKLPAQTVAQPDRQVTTMHSEAEATVRRPVQTAPKAPRVICASGQLSIVAENATLGSVVAAISDCLGVKIELPEGAVGDRVFANLDLGMPQQVLLDFLSSTELDYVIQASVIDRNKIQAVLLSERAGELKSDRPMTAEASDTPARRAWIEGRNALRAAQKAGEERMASEPVLAEAAPLETAAGPDKTALPVPAAVVPNTSEKPVDGATASSAEPVIPTGGADPAAASAQSSDNSKTTSEATGAAPLADTPATKATQQGILSLEQMFEQRKKMMEGQSDTSAPK